MLKHKWNPANNIIVGCIGCGQKMDKPGSKGVCSYCDMRQINKTRLKLHEKKAKDKIEKKSKKLEKINV